jgi:hypothetical protein
MAEEKGNPAGSSFWQIIFPAVLASMIFLLIGVLIVLRVNPANISRFAEISTVLLVIPVLIFSVLFLAALIAMVLLVVRIMKRIPPIFSWILEYTHKIRDAIIKFSDIVVKPIITPAALLGGLRSIFTRDKSRIKIE